MKDSADRSGEAVPTGDGDASSPDSTDREGFHALPWTEVSGRPLVEWTEYQGIAHWWFVHTEFQTAMARTGDAETAFPRGGGRLLEELRLLYRVFASAVARILSIPLPRYRADRARILILTYNHRWRMVRDLEDGGVRPGDAYFDTIIEELVKRGRYQVLTSSPFTGPPDSWHRPLPSLRKALSRRREGRVPHRILDEAWSLDAWRAERKARAHFRALFARNLDLGELIAKLPKDMDRSGAISMRLEYYFNTVFERVVGQMHVGRRFLEALRPDLVVLINEYGRLERALVASARLLDIPVLAIQHGVIHPTHPGYLHSPLEISGTGSVRSPSCPLPNRTAVYGPYHKKLLREKGAYPRGSVVVTGQPRYDLLAHASTLWNRDDVLHSLDLDPAKRTVLWATQTHGLPSEENRQNVEAVYRALARLENAQLVVKLHPNEDQRARPYRRNSSYKPTIVAGDGDTLALLFACELLITHQSTVAMEAVALDRPVIILNLSRKPDSVDYVKEGVAEGVYRPEDLRPAIVRLLSDRTPLSRNRSQYIAKYLFKSDGRATERVVDLIDQMIGA